MAHIPGTGRTRHTHRRQIRRTHGHSGFLPALTGFEETYTQSVIDGVSPSPEFYPEGSIPPGAVDHTPPPAPTGLTLTSDVFSGSDGSSALRLIAALVQPSVSDLFASYVEVTAEGDGNPDPALEVPIWTNPAIIFIGAGKTQGHLLGVRGVTKYWARAYAADIFGNVSAYTGVASVVTGKDTDAPGVPQNATAVGGFKGVGLAWDATSAPDLMVHDVRSVDFSGNVATSQADATAVDWLANPEAGWSGLQSAVPVAVGQADIAVNSIISNHISTAGLSADVIKSGYLRVNTSDGTMIDGIEVWNGGVRVGKWDETGLYVGSTTAGLPTDLSGTDYVKITDAGITVYLAGTATAAITPDGINATAINFGALPGGHNLLQNSSFELADFGSAPATKAWDVAADWTGTEVTNTNATNGAGAVAMTGSTY